MHPNHIYHPPLLSTNPAHSSENIAQTPNTLEYTFPAPCHPSHQSFTPSAGRLKGWASVLSTHSSRLMTSGVEYSR